MPNFYRRCARCGIEWDEPTRRGYCNDCHAANMREWRKTHPLNRLQRRRAVARAYVGVALKRGKIQRGPCVRCGVTEGVRALHHAGYDKGMELVISWYCPAHHHEEAQRLRAVVR